MNRAFSVKEIVPVVNNLKQKAPSQDGFTSEFHQTFKGGIIPALFSLFQKIEQG